MFSEYGQFLNRFTFVITHLAGERKNKLSLEPGGHWQRLLQKSAKHQDSGVEISDHTFAEWAYDLNAFGLAAEHLFGVFSGGDGRKARGSSAEGNEGRLVEHQAGTFHIDESIFGSQIHVNFAPFQ
ncbi:MAG: hypothetical protein HC902_05445 [Calothrix sp. SM1_5_4]|nr:hypothetical protein [Calothrix sp. SM1_5_4]